MANNDIFAQASQAALRGECISREKDAYLYQCAWDREDLETVCKITERAEKDPELQRILDEIDESMINEEGIIISDEQRYRVHAKVQHLMRQYFEKA